MALDTEVGYETCRLILDRPRDGDPHGLVYLAERTDLTSRAIVAVSPVFRPDLHALAHREALEAIEHQLAREGWERMPTSKLDALRVTFRRPR